MTYENKMVDAGILSYEKGAQEYGYTISFHDGVEFNGTILLESGHSYAGVIRGNDPRDAARNVILARTDMLDEFYGKELELVFDVVRNADGSFTVEVDTHGLDDCVIQLQAS